MHDYRHLMEAYLTTLDDPSANHRPGAAALLATTDGKGKAPLHYAAERGLVNMVSLLLKYGANVNQVTTKFRHSTPITLAICGHHTQVVQLLIRSGATLAPVNYKVFIANINGSLF